MKIGFLGALTLIFTFLKLDGALDWSWWAVTSPLWFPWFVIGVVAALITALKAISR